MRMTVTCRRALRVAAFCMLACGPARVNGDDAAAVYGPVARVFAVTPQGELAVHLFTPSDVAGSARRAAIVLFHGGGWSLGEAAWAFPRARHFAARGLVAAAAEYRLSDQGAVSPLEAMADACAAIRWLRAHADSLGVDPERIAAYGWSAGGHLAVAAATFEAAGAAGEAGCEPAALILVSPAVSLAHDRWFQRLLGTRADARDISPDARVRSGMPPTLLLQGDVDTVTPLAGAVRFRDRMRAAGNRCELRVYKGFGHLFTPAGVADDGMPVPDPATAQAAAAVADSFLTVLGFMEASR